MDFNLDETQEELRALAAGLLDRETTPARRQEHERSGAPYDEGLWRSLARAGLLGAVLPEEAGGAGLGPVELAVVLREIGARVAPVPVQQSLVAAMAVARYGDAGQRRELAPLAEGELVLSAAPRGPGGAPGRSPAGERAGSSRVTAREGGGGWLLDGRTTAVPYAAQSARVLVPAETAGGPGLFLVEPAPAVLRPVPLPSGEPGAVLVLDGTPARPVGDPGGPAGEEAVRGLGRLATAASAAVVSGVLAGALELTCGYLRTRRQFGRALAEFQAVTMQIADVYIASRALDVTVRSAVWRLAGHPGGGSGAFPGAIPGGGPDAFPGGETGRDAAGEADTDLAVAAFTAAGPALEALYACQHLHGGIGLDVTYPLHRHFAWGRHHAQLLGGAELQLDTIGALAG
ncbi:acyl-CoA dehydrogenase family protein [Planomonospora corallina]|uniref:Acyl-CoA dehydrogenase family protein n=1 Tax=Planomonospora corallina TaxID=1806052 RepID=A0ABV8IE85_9ACTN